MLLVPVKTPWVVKKMFPDYVWNIKTSESVLYLTFDDGPTPEITEWVLQVLKDYEAKATFFCIGNNIEKHPDIFKSIIRHGHAVGNHTHHHLKGWKTKTNDYLESIAKTQESISHHGKDSTDNIQPLFRPPYGRIKPKQAKQLLASGYQIIMWDVLSYDWDQTISQEKCLNHIKVHTEKGSIIVFHDSIKASKNMMHVLPQILEHYKKLGYTFKPLLL